MKIQIEMPVTIYDRFIDKLAPSSREYAILKNGMIVQHSDAGINERVLEIACEREEAMLLCDSAGRLFPDAVPFITRAIETAPLPRKSLYSCKLLISRG